MLYDLNPYCLWNILSFCNHESRNNFITSIENLLCKNDAEFLWSLSSKKYLRGIRNEQIDMIDKSQKLYNDNLYKTYPINPYLGTISNDAGTVLFKKMLIFGIRPLHIKREWITDKIVKARQLKVQYSKTEIEISYFLHHHNKYYNILRELLLKNLSVEEIEFIDLATSSYFIENKLKLINFILNEWSN